MVLPYAVMLRQTVGAQEGNAPNHQRTKLPVPNGRMARSLVFEGGMNQQLVLKGGHALGHRGSIHGLSHHRTCLSHLTLVFFLTELFFHCWHQLWCL